MLRADIIGQGVPQTPAAPTTLWFVCKHGPLIRALTQASNHVLLSSALQDFDMLACAGELEIVAAALTVCCPTSEKAWFKMTVITKCAGLSMVTWLLSGAQCPLCMASSRFIETTVTPKASLCDKRHCSRALPGLQCLLD